MAELLGQLACTGTDCVATTLFLTRVLRLNGLPVP
jgi:hypothetical protein